MSALLELAERCEAATAEQQQQLLLDAFLAINPDREPGYWPRYNNFRMKLDAGGFVDAALTLVPDDWVVGSVAEEKRREEWVVELRRGHRTSYDKVVFSNFTPGTRCKSLALAICAAALRARAAMEPKRSFAVEQAGRAGRQHRSGE